MNRKVYYLTGLVIVLLLLWLIFSLFQKISSLQEQNQSLISSRDSAYFQAKQYIDKNGELVNQVNTYELTISDLKKVGEELGFENKRLKSQVGNLNNLVGYWKGQATSHGSDTVLLTDTVYVVKGDTIKAQKLNWSNNYLTLEGLYRPIDNKLSFKYTYDIGGFEITSYRKRQGLFKPKQLVTDIRFGDPSMTVSEFRGIVVKEEKKKFWETKGFAIGAGLIGGIYLGSKL